MDIFVDILLKLTVFKKFKIPLQKVDFYPDKIKRKLVEFVAASPVSVLKFEKSAPVTYPKAILNDSLSRLSGQIWLFL